MPRVSAPRLISDAKKPPAAPALDAAVEAAGATTSTPARRTRKTSQSARSGTKTREGATTRAKTSSKAKEPAKPAREAGTEAEATTAATQAADTSRERRKPEFPDEPDGIPGAKRITLPLWYDLWKQLRRRSVEDEIDTTIVIRSAIELYFHDERFQAKVDKLAKLRASSIHRGRPRKDTSR